MSLVIRFSKIGRRGEKKYRIVVKEKRSKRDGIAIDSLGYYEVHPSHKVVKKIDHKKLTQWIEAGAKVSPAVSNIL